MFFIGSLNSVLPYIIYLSLIWVFLVVGITGKVLQARQYLSIRPVYAENIPLQYYDSKINCYYSHPVSDSRVASSDNPYFDRLAFFQEKNSGITVSCDSQQPLDSKYYTVFGFRGPPSPCLSI